MNMELDDLPPRYRAQAEQQLAARKRRAADPLAEAVKQAKAAGRDFDSRGEYEFYTGTVLPKMARGEIVECEQHPAFPLFPAGWKFTEIITAEDKDDLKRWRELEKEG